MNTACGTLQVTDEQIKVIFHLVLQIYCSPSLKEQVHNPVMPLLARKEERTVSILCACSGVCACVCVCDGCICIYMHVCVLHVHGCEVVCTCALVCAFLSVPSE